MKQGAVHKGSELDASFQAQSLRYHQLVYLRTVDLVQFVDRIEEAVHALCMYESDQGMTKRYS